ncbi:DNA phosphorothioation-dependent restriction protein DptG [Flavobacterium saliperosum]|uniref:DNA phosphorothioation-dependent restriction protein DptG n=1 Tax=Flavobacterium saliperosum TaxID=329186 RepID=A0A1G4V2R6_9FLAO|nr:DNA phosphorothioation-dependent restriction protein DptG [Flavobacterium saliperosum]SCX00291.1 DNA phosphorothioation-dependent restriction protein DptG [Flavobacterium saliperosum]
MRTIILHKTGDNSLEKRYFKNKTFSHVTGNQIKLLPFKTNPSGDSFGDDFKSFQGIVGELYRLLHSKGQVEFLNSDNSFKTEFKATILKNALSRVSTEKPEELKNLLSTLFFNEDQGLIKFNSKTLLYMNFINNHNAIKELPKFIIDLFELEDYTENLNTEFETDENILHQLLLESLPELPENKTKTKVSGYYNVVPELKATFQEDFSFLLNNPAFLLKYSEEFFKYYYFHYLNQFLLHLSDFGSGAGTVKAVHYTMDWETLSENRLSNHYIGWKHLNRVSETAFAHVNTLELLNYITIDDKNIGDYHAITVKCNDLASNELELLQEKLKELTTFYTDSITVFDTGKNWEDCERLLALDMVNKSFSNVIEKDIYSLWFKIKYQFENSSRSKPYSDYAKWYVQFGKTNYTKNRGRLGNTMVLSQELLLFLTRLCIGTEDKIRLKVLWDKFKERGIAFDETTKLEITKLFEKINLIEKKSDSGDAQYVKSTI